METQEQPNRTIVIEITFDTEDLENAWLVAQDACASIERWEAVEGVRVLSGVAE